MKNDDVYIRNAEEKDRQDILNLLNTVFSKNQRSTTKREEEFWQWKFKSSVFGSSIVNVAEVNDNIIGVDHLWPWELQCRGITIRACQPCDSVVASDYQGRGIFKQLRMRGIEEAVNRKRELLFNFPNENSLPVNLRIGAQHLGKVTWWVKVLKPLEMMVERFRGGLSSASDIDKEFELDIDQLDRIAEDYKAYDRFISINRKDGFHKWRYQNRPKRQYGMITLKRKGKKIGAIFTMNQKGVSREMVLVDLIGDPMLSNYLFKEIIRAARSLDATFLALMDNPKFKTRQLWKSGFIKKKMKNMVVLPLDLSIERKAINMENWSLVAGMHDSI